MPGPGGNGAGGLPGGHRGAGVLRGDALGPGRRSWNRTFTVWPGRNSTSIPPSSWGRSSSASWACPTARKTKTGWSTNADVLEKLRYEAPIVGAVLEYRQYAKLKSTYADGLLKAMDPRRPRPHPVPDDRHRHRAAQLHESRICRTFPPAPIWAAKSGRCSSRRQGCVLVDADYSQIELRLLAHISGDHGHAGGLHSPARISTPPRRRRCSMWIRPT